MESLLVQMFLPYRCCYYQGSQSFDNLYLVFYPVAPQYMCFKPTPHPPPSPSSFLFLVLIEPVAPQGIKFTAPDLSLMETISGTLGRNMESNVFEP